MTRHVAPCGHPGQPIIGTFVLCSRGCGEIAPVDPEASYERRAIAAWQSGHLVTGARPNQRDRLFVLFESRRSKFEFKMACPRAVPLDGPPAETCPDCGKRVSPE